MTIYQRSNISGQLSKGQKTKQQILNAAIDVLAHQGIKGATHRSIAKQANLQLSLTTYYFKDIRQLINEAFLMSSNRTIARAQTTWLKVFALCDSLGKTKLKKLVIRKELALTLTDLAADYLMEKVTHHGNDLMVEQMLYTEMQSTEALRSLAYNHRQAVITPFIKLCSYFNTDTAQIDGDILLTVFTQLEYRNLTVPVENIDRDYIYQTLHRLIHWILKVKKPAVDE